jgi:hypothetical protein
MIHTKHLWRAALLLVVFGGAAFVGRHVLIPETFGAAGFYRYGSLAEFMNQPVRHGTSASCTSCHAEIATAKSEGKHAGISCEVCHEPVVVHATEQEKTAPMPVNRSHGLCAYCHEQLQARPAAMPQIKIRQHLVTLEVIGPQDEIPEGVCGTCHDVHSPVGQSAEEPQDGQPAEESQEVGGAS